MSFTNFSKNIILDEVVSRPKSTTLNARDSFFFCDFNSKEELDLFFNFLAFMILFFDGLSLQKNNSIYFRLTLTSVFICSLYNPGFYFSFPNYKKFFSSWSYLASLKGFFD